MGLKEAILLVLAAFSILSYTFVEGRSVSEKDQSSDKKVIKTIKTEAGQLFECVNIYEQPALDHPLLKSHKIQLKPSFYPEGFKMGNSANFSQIGMKKIGCPSGTVPILRFQRDLRKQATLLSQRQGTDVPRSPGHHILVAKTKEDQNAKYHGSRTYMAVYNPKVSWEQFSEGAMWINSGPTDQLNSIQVGWTVNPAIYGDTRTHLFGYWTADGFNQTGCFDIRCAGFVQINADASLGLLLEPTSRGRDQYEGLFHMFQDAKTGDWWLAILHNLLIGYWPKYLFTSLASHATEIAWGGEVFSPLNEAAPPMGSGQFFIRDEKATCYARDIQIIDEFHKYKDLRDIKIVVDGYNYGECYDVGYTGYRRYIGYTVLFGGPGGWNCNN